MSQTGTGFVISNNGHLVTNHHVIDGCVGDISGRLSGEVAIKLRLVSSDETNDLALLQAPGPFKGLATIEEAASGPATPWSRSAIPTTACCRRILRSPRASSVR